MARIPCAIIGSGNIGTDLMIKVMRMSKTLEMGAMVGIDPASDGLARAARLSVPTTHEGIEGLRGLPNYAHVGVVFDATSAGAHIRNNEILQRDGKKVIDLTPAAIRPFTIPVINGDANLDKPNVNMVTCGGQATIPMVYAVRRATKRGAQAAQPPSRRTCVASGRNRRIFVVVSASPIWCLPSSARAPPRRARRRWGSQWPRRSPMRQI